MRVRLFLCLAGFAGAALAGCSGGSGTASMPSTALQPQAPAQTIAFSESGFVDTSDATAAAIGVRLTGEIAVTNKSYGKLLGYAKGTVTKTTHVITLMAGQSVIFHNVDSGDPHTASFLGDATNKSAPWPTQFNGSSAQSKAGTDISKAGFSTGTMSAGTNSLKYVAKIPGFYMFGCAFHYNLFGMRDIIIVQ